MDNANNTFPGETPQSSPPRFKLPIKTIIIVVVILLLGITGVISWYLTQSKPASEPSLPLKKYSTIPPKAEFAPDQLIVQFQKGVSPSDKTVQDDLHNLDLVSMEPMYPQIKDDNLQRFYILRFRSGSDIRKIHDVLQKKNYIEGADPNYKMVAQDVPNDAYYSQMWDLAKIQADKAWTITKGSNDVIVGVVDTGIDASNPDFAGRSILVGKDFSSCSLASRCNPTNSITDDVGHGTHVAGTIGAVANNNIGIAGIDWNVTLLGEKVLSAATGGYEYSSTAGIIDAVDRGAKVINISLGTNRPASCSNNYQSALDYAYNKGVTVVVAAGNLNADSSKYSPSGCQHIIVVGATDQNDARSIWSATGASDYGSNVDIGAPGTKILSLKSSICSVCSEGVSVGGNYLVLQGTSMAAPHVTGVAALLLAQNPGWSPDQVKQCLVQSGDPITTDRPIGGVRLDAYNALSGCNRNPPPPSGEGSISGKVFVDTNEDRTLGTGESGFANAELDLTGPVSKQQNSSADGTFNFLGLPFGEYTLSVKIYGLLLSQYHITLSQDLKSFSYDVPVPPGYITPTPGSQSLPPSSSQPSLGSSNPLPSNSVVVYDCKMVNHPSEKQSLGLGSLQCTPSKVVQVSK